MVLASVNAKLQTVFLFVHSLRRMQTDSVALAVSDDGNKAVRTDAEFRFKYFSAMLNSQSLLGGAVFS